MGSVPAGANEGGASPISGMPGIARTGGIPVSTDPAVARTRSGGHVRRYERRRRSGDYGDRGGGRSETYAGIESWLRQQASRCQECQDRQFGFHLLPSMAATHRRADVRRNCKSIASRKSLICNDLCQRGAVGSHRPRWIWASDDVSTTARSHGEKRSTAREELMEAAETTEGKNYGSRDSSPQIAPLARGCLIW